MPQTKLSKHELYKLRAYSWVAYMISHESEEIKHLLHYGTPSDRLIAISNRKSIKMMTSQGIERKIFFPESLNKSAGQKLLYKIAVQITEFVKTTPIQAHNLFNDISDNLQVRRLDTRANFLMVAEAVCHRAASELKHEVLFAFDSINTWINAAYGKELGYHTIRKALETLQEQGFIKVNEWGSRGVRSKATKIEILPSALRNNILTYTSNLDEWLLYKDHAMTKVYARESVTRQNVLEERIHHYADSLVEKEMSDGPVWPTLIFPLKTAKLDATAEVAEEIEFKEIWDDAYIDRLLGRLVPAVQETFTSTGQSSTAIQSRTAPTC